MQPRPVRGLGEAVYADFGFTAAEVVACDFCGASEWDELADLGCSLVAYSVPITRRCPVAGLIGVCLRCFERLKRVDYDGDRELTIRREVFEGRPYRVR